MPVNQQIRLVTPDVCLLKEKHWNKVLCGSEARFFEMFRSLHQILNGIFDLKIDRNNCLYMFVHQGGRILKLFAIYRPRFEDLF